MRHLPAAAFALVAFAAPVSAAPFLFEFSGTLRDADKITVAGGGADLLGSDRSFLFSAVFDTASPNLVGFFPFPGFVAYAPSTASFTIGGTSYDMTPYSAATPDGVAVTLFDPRQVFFPGLYGAGFIANPAVDGAGIVGDFSGATPPLLVDAIVDAVFTGYNGTGFNDGPGCAPVDPAPCVPTPIALSTNGVSYSLVLAPNSDVVGGPLASAQLSAIPEPASLAVLATGLGLAAAGLRRRTDAAA